MASPGLTALSHGAGCACKLSPAALHPLLADLPKGDDERLLVGFDTADDAAVYQVAEDLAVVTTVDFFTPIVDDPYDFGQIAAANALSDVYAMGATPVTALNLVAFSIENLGGDVLREILRGGQDKATEAGVTVAGGHSIDDPEPKYGLAVTGLVHPKRLVRNSTGKPGDELWLTKPVGGGAATTALKRGTAPEGLEARVISVMSELNAEAARLALEAGATAMTDVTGFGLLGHLHELASASGVAADLNAAAVPAIEGVEELLAGAEPPIAGGSRRNRDWVGPHVDWAEDIPEHTRWLLCDAMTSGGLLVAVPAGNQGPGVRVGSLAEGQAGRIAVSASAS